MKKFLGVLRYEYSMSIRRRSLLVIMFLFAAFFIYLWADAGVQFQQREDDITQALLAEAAQTVFFLNLFFPVIVGVSSADRAVRDDKLGVREILRSTGLGNFVHVLGKYFGVAFSMLTVELVIVILISTILVTLSALPLAFVLYSLLAVMLISAPAIFFVTAFSLACPLVMPVRVYQIMFTGYWYWGNYLSPQVLPTVSNTLLNASGRFPMIAFFGEKVATNWASVSHTEAVANILILLGCAALALTAMIAYLNWREKRA
ncbi:MAG: hypothetical protein DWQ07_10155 [Chloroflexi bacterium]|nr:MAG: hypothetical protein DWQ07_10155 [Chloroflexota bacterium]MBL1192927.1 hypothetical protein [Chloroflexota bacterium]NOH10220.1 hypothetical protein [Chloroflexota bacterium]